MQCAHRGHAQQELSGVEVMRYTEIDGERYEVKDCGYCPFRDMGDDGWNAHCTHPLVDQDPKVRLEINHDGIADGCPLRDAHHDMDEIINKMLKQKGYSLTQTWYKSNVKVVMDAEKGILHEVRPCPFCGSTDIEEIYYDDEGDMLEEWMMEEANKDGCDYKSWQEYLDTNGYVFMVACPNCHGSVSSKDSIMDAWAKWNRRV